jgi:predicted ABC-type sugar transport system permease subunit
VRLIVSSCLRRTVVEIATLDHGNCDVFAGVDEFSRLEDSQIVTGVIIIAAVPLDRLRHRNTDCPKIARK